MTTIARRAFRSTPARDAFMTWTAIVDMLTQDKEGEAKAELLAVAGVVASVIADYAPTYAPIVVTCDGPRTRIYCLYDDDAIEGSDAREDPLGFDPLAGDWRVSLPCSVDDLPWVEKALKRHSSRITARDLTAEPALKTEPSKDIKAQTLVLDSEGFLRS